MRSKIRIVSALLVTTLASAAWATDNNWVANGTDTKVSTVANWSTSTVPSDNMRFTDAAAGKTVTFDDVYTLTDYIWIGSMTEGTFYKPTSGTTAEVFNPVIWEATASTNGISMSKNTFRMADSSSQNAGLQIESGTYKVLDHNFQLGAGGGTAKLVVNGGLIETTGDFIMSNSDTGYSELVIGSGNATRSAKITVPTYKWAKLTASDNGSAKMILKAGGEFDCGFLQMNAANSTVVFDGGTFVKVGDVSNTTGSLFGRNQNESMFLVNEGAKLEVTANGGTLDIGSTVTRIDFPIVLADGATSGTLVTKGSACLTLNGATNFTGTIHVSTNGVVKLPVGAQLGGLEIEDGAFVWLASDETIAAGATLLTVTSDITSLADKIVANGVKTTVEASNGKWLVKSVAYGTDDVPCTYWISASSDSISTAANWTDGAPSETNCAAFLKSAFLHFGGDHSIKKVIVGTNCTLTVHKSGSSWPNLRAEEIRGPGKIVLSSCGIKPISGKTLNLYADVSTDPTVGGAEQDCWIEGNDATSRLELYGTITANGQGVRVNQAMDIYGKIVYDHVQGDDNYIVSSVLMPQGEIDILAGAGFDLRDSLVISGKVSVAEGATYTLARASQFVAGSVLNADGTLTISAGQTFAGNLTGTGTVNVVTEDAKTVTLSGNNEAFAGIVNKANRGAIRFDSATSGSPLACWNIGGDIRSSVTNATIKLGQVNYYKTGNWYVCYAENSKDEATALTFEIGARGGNSNLGTAEDICKGDGYVYLRKVGSGNLDLWFDQYKSIDLHEGTVSFRNNNGPTLTYVFTGGTMRLPYIPTWDFLNRIKNSTGPVTIDTDGTSYGLLSKGTIDSSNIGGFTKLGEGTLTIWGDTAYTGSTTVKAGKLFIKGALTDSEGKVLTGGGTVTVDEGASLVLYCDHVDFTAGTAQTVLNGSIDAASAQRVIVSGKNFEFTVSAGDSVAATPAAADNSVANRWVGLPEDIWTTPACWSKGCPVADQIIAFDYSARVANISASIDLNKIVLPAGTEVQFVTLNYKTHPSLNVHSVEISGEGEATIALDHCGIQSRDGRKDTSDKLNFRMVSTSTDSWLKEWNLKGKILGTGVLRPYICYFYGDNSEFNGTITIQDSGNHICDVAASATNAVWQLWADVNFDITEGTFKMGEMDCRKQCVWYSVLNSTAVIEVGHKNTDFGSSSSAYFFGPDAYNDNEVPPLTFKKVGTGTWYYYGKGIRNIVVEEGELELRKFEGTDDTTKHFDNHKGKQIDTLVVKAGATLSGTAGDQPIYSLTFENGAILKQDLAWSTNTVDEVVTTNGLTTATLTVSGSVDLSNTIVTLGNTDLTNQVDEAWSMPTLLSVTGTGNTLTGTPTLGCTAISNLVVNVADNKLSLAYGTPVAPGETVTVTTEAEAEAAAAKPINLPVERATLGQQASYFTNVVTKVSDESYTVETKLNEEKVAPDSSASAMAMTSANDVALTPGNVKKGLYYGIAELDSPTDTTTKPSSGSYELATGSSLTLSTPVSSDKVKYYRVWVSDTAQ